MGLARFYKNALKSSYNFGKRASAAITEDMPAEKAKTVGSVVDIAAGVGLTAFFGSPIVAWGSTTVAAVTNAIAYSALIPTALMTVGTAAVAVGLGAFGVALGAGFLSSAMDRLGIAKPRAEIAEAKQAVQKTAQTVAKPFKWVGNKLGNAFKKAHDGANNEATPAPLQVLQPKTQKLEV